MMTLSKPAKRALTLEEWAALRARWEGAAEPGFTALAAEALAAWGVAITRQGIADMAKRRGWCKGASLSMPLAATAGLRCTTPVQAQKSQVDAQVLAQVPQVPQAAQVQSSEVADELIEAGATLQGHSAPKRGRPSKYLPSYCEDILAYFDKEPFTEVDVPQPNGLVKRQRMATDPPTLSGFAKSIGVSVDTLGRWATEVLVDGGMKHGDFAEAYARAREMQEALIIRGGLLGLYEPRTAQAALKNLHGWQDQPERKVAVSAISREELDRIYGTAMAASRARMQALMEERAHLRGERVE